MNDLEIKKQAKAFAEYWANKGYEKGESQKFWLDLLEHVLGIDNAREYISFEDQIKIDKTSFIVSLVLTSNLFVTLIGMFLSLNISINIFNLSSFSERDNIAISLYCKILSCSIFAS